MSYRFRTYGQPSRRLPEPRVIMAGLLAGFVLVSLLLLLAGRLPFSPTPTPPQGSTYRGYVERDRQLLDSYGYTLEGSVHIPIERAIQLTAERGLPTREAPSASTP